VATERTATKKSTGKKSTGNKSTTKKSATKRSTAKKSGDAPRASAPRRPRGIDLARAAAQQLGELTGREAEGVTGLERTDDGWKAQVEVLELRRIPETTDVLALYEVDLDSEGDVEGYRRLHRYTRGESGRSER
jgi:hypothetical protein